MQYMQYMKLYAINAIYDKYAIYAIYAELTYFALYCIYCIFCKKCIKQEQVYLLGFGADSNLKSDSLLVFLSRSARPRFAPASPTMSPKAHSSC